MRSDTLPYCGFRAPTSSLQRGHVPFTGIVGFILQAGTVVRSRGFLK
jgi:hypothetical protein